MKAVDAWASGLSIFYAIEKAEYRTLWFPSLYLLGVYHMLGLCEAAFKYIPVNLKSNHLQIDTVITSVSLEKGIEAYHCHKVAGPQCEPGVTPKSKLLTTDLYCLLREERIEFIWMLLETGGKKRPVWPVPTFTWYGNGKGRNQLYAWHSSLCTPCSSHNDMFP